MTGPRRRLERAIAAVLLGLGLVLAAVTTHDAWKCVGRRAPGFAVMENLLVGPGGIERGPLLPFDRVVSVEGRTLVNARQLDVEVARHPPGTPLHYTVLRGTELREFVIPTRIVGTHAFSTSSRTPCCPPFSS
jgi:hypothetical protein